MTALKIGSLFTGYAGLDRAAQTLFTGADIAWHCEIDPAAIAVLEQHYPGVRNLGDVAQVNWGAVEPVDILTGGSPCQDLSDAGKRAGMADGTRSNLWVNMREAIAQLQPKLVIWENVQGALHAEAHSSSDLEPAGGLLGGGAGHLRALGRVLGDLTEIGYDARWTTIRASDVGAPHRRPRVFLIAYAANSPILGLQTGKLPWGAGAQIAKYHRDAALFSPLRQPLQAGLRPELFGDYAATVRRWELVTGQPAPAPTEPALKGGTRLSTKFLEWMMGVPPGWVTGVPGLKRHHQIQVLGNGVVPLQATAAVAELLGGELLSGANR